MGSIVLSGIEKSFGTTAVLKQIGIEIRDGEFLTLVGPSGCGKSTLLRILAGLEAQDAGDVSIDGRNVNKVRPSDRDLAMVFQSYALYPHLTVADNMLTPLRMRDLTTTERLPLFGKLLARDKYKTLHGQVMDTAKALKIEALLDRKPGQLSGGQRQRAALGRAMVRNPVAFLMDEPLSNLDAALRVHMRSELAQLHRSLGVTFVYVTHDQAEALTMSDRMAVMMGGRILQLAAPQQVYDDPADLAVAQFVGSPKINTLPGNVDGGGRVSCLGVTLRRRLAAVAARTVTIGLRPEHLTVEPRGEEECFAGTVRHRENLGSDVYLHVELADGAHTVVVRATPVQAAGHPIGAQVRIGRSAGEALAFSEDGSRMRFLGAVPAMDAMPARDVA